MLTAVSVMMGRTKSRGWVTAPKVVVIELGHQRREDVQMQGEDVDQDDPEEERGHRVEHEGQRRDRVVADAVAPDRLGDAQRHRDQQRQHERRAREIDAAPGVLLEQLGHALPLLVGVAEVQVAEVAQIGQELADQRPVVAVLFVPGGDLGRFGAATEHRVDRAAGDQVQQLEGDRGDPDRDHDRHEDAADDVSDHRRARRSGRRAGSTSCSPTRTEARVRTASG